MSKVPLRELIFDGTDRHSQQLTSREWLITNGLGGYASGTVANTMSRRYHGYLIAALPPPYGRTVLLNQLTEEALLPGDCVVRLGDEHNEIPSGNRALTGFALEQGIPVWRYRWNQKDGALPLELERRIFFVYLQNTTIIQYRVLGEQGIRLKLTPFVHFRGHELDVAKHVVERYEFQSEENGIQIDAGSTFPPVRLQLRGSATKFTKEERIVERATYEIEESRGYTSVGDLFSGGALSFEVAPNSSVSVIISCESPEVISKIDPEAALKGEQRRREKLVAQAHPALHDGLGAELVLAADQFIIHAVNRAGNSEARDVTNERTIIAGYHWFTDWGRDTMISLEGLTLATGRIAEGGAVIRSFAKHVRDGLIPNLFPEGERQGLYHTADATLWFFEAVGRYLEYSRDAELLETLLPTFQTILQKHIEGTSFGIEMDPADGLLRQGSKDYPLTWMDARVEGWVVTPRRGKAVEINALWFNALSWFNRWVPESTHTVELAELIRRSFNERFWIPEGGYLFDIVDGEQGDDSAIRPNQIFSFSLTHPVLDEIHWSSVLDIVSAHLRTPFGLRSLSRNHPSYQPKYFGDLRARDAAYHQGTVWAWLIGPYFNAWTRVHPMERAGAEEILRSFNAHLNDGGIGTVSEIMDAEEPFFPRGCIAQAWSVAELIRCMVALSDTKTSLQ